MKTRLKNGATMIGYLEDRFGDRFVAAECNGTGLPFATWQMNDQDETFWGHYFKTREDAMEDLHDRAGPH